MIPRTKRSRESHIIGGVPETGKTTIALAYAAIISSGATWPDGTRAAVGNVLIWTSEDDPADTLVPRLIRMGAELSRIHFIEQAISPGAKSRPFNPATDMLALVAKAAAIGDVVLLILDPVMVRIKSNIGPSGGGFGYHIDMATLIENPAIEATRIVWESELEGTAKELLNSAEGDQTGKVPKLGMAKQFLADILASARLPATEIETFARAANVSWASVRRASDEMGIRKFREGNKSWWQLT